MASDSERFNNVFTSGSLESDLVLCDVEEISDFKDYARKVYEEGSIDFKNFYINVNSLLAKSYYGLFKDLNNNSYKNKVLEHLNDSNFKRNFNQGYDIVFGPQDLNEMTKTKEVIDNKNFNELKNLYELESIIHELSVYTNISNLKYKRFTKISGLISNKLVDLIEQEEMNEPSNPIQIREKQEKIEMLNNYLEKVNSNNPRII